MTSVVGVDIGGTKVAAAPLRDGELGESVLQPTTLTSATELLDQLVALIKSIRGNRLEAVGIGVPSVVEFETGRVVSSVNIPLADVPLRQTLSARLGVPTFVDNDATVAALAEAHDERMKLVAQHLVMLTIGTGVGGGFVLGGRIYRGAMGGAGEIGHTIIGLDAALAPPEPGDFPQPPSLEYLASGQALDRLAVELAGEVPQSALGRLVAGGKPVLGRDLVLAAAGGDPLAAGMVEIWAQRIGIGIANAINTFNPQEVVIGGGAAQSGELLLAPAKRIAHGYVLPGLRNRTTIRLARWGVRAGVLGAALLAVHELGSSGG